jgi:hypothetical protein
MAKLIKSVSIEFALTGIVVTSRLTLWLFLLAQACDGLFTYVAVRAFGVLAEGNFLLATWIGLIGAGPAVVGAKSMAVACGVFLYGVGKQWVLLGLTVMYVLAAIGPWLLVYHQLAP